MATETSRTFDFAHGAVIVQVSDSLGRPSSHTIYVTGPAGVANIDAAVADILTKTEAAATAMQAAFVAAGWVPSGN